MTKLECKKCGVKLFGKDIVKTKIPNKAYGKIILPDMWGIGEYTYRCPKCFETKKVVEPVLPN